MIYRPLLWYLWAFAFGEVLARSGVLWIWKAVVFGVSAGVWAGLARRDLKRERLENGGRSSGKRIIGQRKLLWLALPCFFVLGALLYQGAEGRFAELPKEWEGVTAEITGKVKRIEEREGQYRVWVGNGTGRSEHSAGENTGEEQDAGAGSPSGGSNSSGNRKDRKQEEISLPGIVVFWDRLPDGVMEGKKVRFTAELSLPEAARNPGQFDSREYYKALGITCTGNGKQWLEVSGRGDPLRTSLRSLRRFLAEGLIRAEDGAEGILQSGGQTAGLLRAMLLGEKWAADPEVKAVYEASGIGHLLAISGLHISLAGMGLYRLLRRKLGASYGLSVAACTGTAFLCYLLTGEGASACRAFLMLAVYCAGKAKGRRYDVASAAALAALIMIIKQPFLLFQSGFQLSCGSVLALGMVYPRIRAATGGNEGARAGRLGQAKRAAARLLQAVLPGISLQLVTWPIQAAAFCQLPVYSLFLNLFLLPLFPAVALSGLAAAFSGRLLPAKATGICLLPAKLLLKLYRTLGAWSLQLPGAIWRTGEPGRWQIMAYGIFLAGLYVWIGRWETGGVSYGQKEQKTNREKRAKRKRWREMKKGKNREKKSGCKRRRYLALAGALFLLPLCLSHLPSRRLELTFLDVGQGDSCFLRTPEGITALIDGGSSDEKEIGFYTIGPFLDSQAVGTVDLVFASHGDSDHMNGIEELLLENRVGALLLPKNWRTREKLAGLGELAKKQGIPVYGIAAGDRITAGALTLTCLWPEEEPGALEENEASMVLWGSYGEFDVLFTGDLEGEGEESVLRNMAEGAVRGENKIPEAAGSGKPDSLKAGKGLEILKVSHHGSGGASSEAFLERVRPVYGVISCGRNNRYGHPAQETLKRLADKDCHVIRTDLSGAVTVRTDGKRYAVSAFFSSDSRK